MNNELKTPKTLIEAVRYFSSEAICVEFLSQLKWGGAEKCCTNCGSTAVYGLKTRPTFKCRDCKKQFSMKKGTLMEKSPLPLSKWLPVLWQVLNCKNGISSYEIARAIGVHQETAWFMLHRCREAMANNSTEKLGKKNPVEIDETFLGHKSKNMHAKKREALRPRKGVTGNKTVVVGMVERDGEVRAEVVNNTRKYSLYPPIFRNIEEGSLVYTDKLRSYDHLSPHFDHSSVDHKNGQYVNGDTHTNNLECFWSLFKRTVKGTYVHIAPFHTDRYLDEQSFRYNNRKASDSERFIIGASNIFGKRLTYAELTGSADQQ